MAVMMTITMMSLANAMYAGDNYTFQVNTTSKLYWDVVGNSSNMEGFEVYQEAYDTHSNITFTTDIRMMPDNFTIILFENVSHDVVSTIYVGGGRGSTTKYKTEYVYRNVTEYIGIGKDDTIVDDTEDELCEECDESKFNVVPWILLGLIMFYMIISVLSSWSRARKSKQAEEEEQDQKDWKIVEDIE